MMQEMTAQTETRIVPCSTLVDCQELDRQLQLCSAEKLGLPAPQPQYNRSGSHAASSVRLSDAIHTISDLLRHYDYTVLVAGPVAQFVPHAELIDDGPTTLMMAEGRVRDINFGRAIMSLATPDGLVQVRYTNIFRNAEQSHSVIESAVDFDFPTV